MAGRETRLSGVLISLSQQGVATLSDLKVITFKLHLSSTARESSGVPLSEGHF